MTVLVLAVIVGILGAIALGVVVVGMLWLVQFVIGNEEQRGKESR